MSTTDQMTPEPDRLALPTGIQLWRVERCQTTTNATRGF